MLPEHLQKEVDQRWDYWKNHELVGVEEGEKIQAYYLKHPDQKLRIEGCLIIFSPEGVVITGDYVPGGRHAVSSPYGYDRAWFASNLSSSYLACKFLEKKWNWKLAVTDLIEELEEDGEDYYGQEKLTALKEIASELSDCSTDQFCDELADAGYEICDGIPGWDYDPAEFSLLIAIQRRFAELWNRAATKTLTNIDIR